MVGRTISHYEILEKIGAGGMGTVFSARDVRLDRLVAFKILDATQMSNPVRRARFVREARAASALNHPNIVTIFDIGTADDIDYIAMELVRGRTIRDLIGPTGMPLPEMLDYARQTASALAAAHAAGIVHRDIKPANIMVNDAGLVKLLDFGLARVEQLLLDEAESTGSLAPLSLTSPGIIVGTTSYMSPEQVQGKDIDQRSDIFSHGIVMYQMLTGALPFQGPSEVAVMYAIAHTTVPPVTKTRQDLPPALDRVIATAMEKDPALRYARMNDVLKDLAEISRELESGVLLKEVTEAHRLKSRQHRWRRPAILAAIALPLLVIAAFALWHFAPRWFVTVPAEKKIAVLPFLNVGGSPENAAFCEGLMESLTSELTELSQFHGSLWVVPASEVRRGSLKSAQEAQRALGANLVITGSVQRDSSHMHLTANLVDANTLRQLRSRDIMRTTAEFADLQETVVQEVATMLQLEFGSKERQALEAGETKASGAYDFYLQARGYLERRTKGDIDQAIAKFHQAVQLDPKYALAYAGLGEAYWRKYRDTRDTQWVAPAEQNCQKALDLNHQLAPVYVTLGIIKEGTGHYDDAIDALNKAIQIEPTNASAYSELGHVLESVGKMSDAESTYKKGAQLRPADWTSLNDLGLFYYRQGRYQEATPLFLKITALTPDNSHGYTNLGAVYWADGKFENAAANFKRSQELSPTASGYANLGTLYFFLGRCTDAVPLMEQASKLLPKSEQVWGNLGDAYNCLPGSKDKAAAAYRHALDLAQQRATVNPKDGDVLSEVAMFQARLGQNAQAKANVRKARELTPASRNVVWHAALTCELIGDRDAALEALKAALAAGQPVAEVRSHPTLASLRSDPRYEKMMAERGGK